MRRTMKKNNYDELCFYSGHQMPGPIFSPGVGDKGAIGPNGENVVEVRIASGGTIASDDVQNHPSLMYVHGSVNYDGLRRIFYVRSARYVQFMAPYVAESWSSGDATYGPGFKSPDPHELGGFSIHVDGKMGAAQDLEVVIYSAKGTYYDSLVFSQDMYDVLDINHMFDKPIPLLSNDRVEVRLSGSSTQQKDVTTKLYVRKV